MFSTGSKYFLGITAAAFIAAVVYGITQDFGALGGIGLSFLVVAAGGIAAAVIASRDGDVSAMDDTAVATAAAGARPAGGGLWPLVGGLGGALLVIGTVTDKRYFVAGIALVMVAVGEWAVQGWAERASADARYNEHVRAYVLHPLELPVAGALGLAGIIYGFSRVMLAVSKEAGPAIFVVAAALITVFGALFSAKPQLRTTMVGAICAAGAVLVVAGGIAGAATGERDELIEAHEEDHFGSTHRECESAEISEVDEDGGGTVANKANPWATLTFDGSTLTAREIAGPPSQTITVDRGNWVSVEFHNDSDEERRLTVFAGETVTVNAGIEIVEKDLFCTRAIGEGKVAWLTFRMPKPSAAGDYYAYIPGVETARVEIVVP